MDGAGLGWGTDIGGSIRIPTSYCGIYGLKFSFGRASSVGAHSTSAEQALNHTADQGTPGTMPGFETIQAVTGPMARYVDHELLATAI